jgi:5-methylcytosine-specific restriction endonuclease McrA
MNPRITKRERGLLKGAIRRVFSRSDLRKSILDASVVSHSDPKRKRVKTWVKCAVCGKYDAKSSVAIDHIQPVVPLDRSFEEMSLDEVVDRMWCDPTNLQTICEKDHLIKSKEESRIRRDNKRSKKNGK